MTQLINEKVKVLKKKGELQPGDIFQMGYEAIAKAEDFKTPIALPHDKKGVFTVPLVIDANTSQNDLARAGMALTKGVPVQDWDQNAYDAKNEYNGRRNTVIVMTSLGAGTAFCGWMRYEASKKSELVQQSTTMTRKEKDKHHSYQEKLQGHACMIAAALLITYAGLRMIGLGRAKKKKEMTENYAAAATHDMMTAIKENLEIKRQQAASARGNRLRQQQQ